MVPYNERMIHVRFEGQSWNIALAILNINADSSPQKVRTALANHFDVPISRFSAYVIEQHSNGNITIRPEAVFG